ncbi:MAG: aryl-sulfate sulfotransferase [Bacteroidia bacterium]|nr:aryl-sulfate sulfotransferase [Bacteroidia bacterium]
MGFKKNIVLLLVLLVTGICFQSCESSEFVYTIEHQLNPNGMAPLTAEIQISSEEVVKASIEVLGATTYRDSISRYANDVIMPVLGLYPNSDNKVVVTLDHANGSLQDTLTITTAPLPDWFPEIEINTLKRDEMEPGLHACDMHFANNGVFRSMPFLFDDEGEVRWYLDLSFHGKMVSPFQRLKDGTILMVGRHTIYEFDMMGKTKNKIEIDPNFGMHHDVIEIPSGNLLICVGKRNAFINLEGENILSDSDFIMHYDRGLEQITGEWDLGKSLDVDRNDLNFFRPGDWLHMNGLAFNSKDGTTIVSAKNQGLIKVNWSDELQWILAPHKNWGKAGRDGQGFDTRPYLLTAINASGQPYPSSVQIGETSAADFDFPWGPHAPKLLPNGNILVFDNGTYRNFNDDNRYSRVVEYEIDDTNKTVRQVWQYGKERGEEFYSSIVSDADYLPGTENILVTSGYILPQSNHSGKIVEVNRKTGEEVFEATLYFKTLNGDKTVAGWGQTDILYRSERMPLKK